MAKCWDIALVNLHAHESITVKCPSFYAYGGAERYGHFGHVTIHGNSELTFVLDVLECQPTVDKINDKNEAARNRALRVYNANAEKPDESDDEETAYKKQAQGEIKKAQEGLDAAKKALKTQK